jgi:SAM-dependent methyltransferase
MADGSSKLGRLEATLYNEGERLVPGVTHSLEEMVRHRSSYEFFIAAIEADLRLAPGKLPVSILDLGFGTGHGCRELARIPGVNVIGIDNSPACLRYARRHYGAGNVSYEIADIADFVRTMPLFDYVVSRGVMEHVPNGLKIVRSAKWQRRLMIDLPYDEPEGINPHHLVSKVTAASFSDYPDPEFFYEEVSGAIYAGTPKVPPPNMIMCVCTAGGSPRLATLLDLPRAPWRPIGPYGAMAPHRSLWQHFADRLLPVSK